MSEVKEKKKMHRRPRGRSGPSEEAIANVLAKSANGDPIGTNAKLAAMGLSDLSVKANFAETTVNVLKNNAQLLAQKLIDIALNDDHKDQVQALKVCWDRMMPIMKAESSGHVAGKQVSINVIVSGSHVFENERVIEGSS